MEPHLSEVKETNYSLQAACNLDDGKLWNFLSFTNKTTGPYLRIMSVGV